MESIPGSGTAVTVTEKIVASETTATTRRFPNSLLAWRVIIPEGGPVIPANQFMGEKMRGNENSRKLRPAKGRKWETLPGMALEKRDRGCHSKSRTTVSKGIR